MTNPVIVGEPLLGVLNQVAAVGRPLQCSGDFFDKKR